MGKGRKRKIYFFYDDQLQIHKVKRFHLRIVAIALSSLIVFIGLVLVINHFSSDALGIEHDRLSSLMKENQALQQQLSSITQQMKQVQSNLDSLGEQGDFLRLMVDLPEIDKETKSGGTGGAVIQPGLPSFSDHASELLQAVTTGLSQLKSEMAVQTQSYHQILGKAEFNKKYFASIPALKPMAGFYSKTGFGLRMHPVLGIFRVHDGLDIVNDVGTPVYATGDGTVEIAGPSESGYGIMIVINHGFGFQTLYAHLSKALVKEGQHVKRGDLIARSGRTGLVSGPHLHYEVRHNGVSENPVNFFFDELSPQDYHSRFASR